NVLQGNAGNDRLVGGRGDDVLSGGGGSDRIDARDGHRFIDRVTCGAGRGDTALVDADDHVARGCEHVHRGKAVDPPPTDVLLSNASVAEGLPVGTTVGTPSATDRDPRDRHVFALVAGAGATDNASFRIAGSTLQTNAVLQYATKSSYAIRIRVRDAHGAA